MDKPLDPVPPRQDRGRAPGTPLIVDILVDWAKEIGHDTQRAIGPIFLYVSSPRGENLYWRLWAKKQEVTVEGLFDLGEGQKGYPKFLPALTETTLHVASPTFFQELERIVNG